MSGSRTKTFREPPLNMVSRNIILAAIQWSKRVDTHPRITGIVTKAELPTVTRNGLIEAMTRIDGQNNVRRVRQDIIAVLLPQSLRHSA